LITYPEQILKTRRKIDDRCCREVALLGLQESGVMKFSQNPKPQTVADWERHSIPHCRQNLKSKI